ncbi:excisionase family DNA-binding protein [Burkholderia sp. THE68]|uniref:excisionase family DNA-binding protein n=1 Tax=Burkholderia sp. THE68 TaxID=758782 RepID=UPI001389BE9F|nr:excisionase family DNA-binding protein [Burkholderia sp. THE68]
MSTTDAAKLLFVSRPHVVKLLAQGKSSFTTKLGKSRFLTKASVLAYQAHLDTEAKA